MTSMGKITPIMCNTLQEDDVRIAKNLLENNNRWLDPNPVSEAEKWLAQWLGVKKAFGFMGGRAALYNIVKALGLSRGDEVILPGLTCQVVVNAFEYNHVKCVHADIERETFNLDVKEFSQKVTSKTKAVLLQHTFGIPARDTLAIVSLAKKFGLIVIEDVAHGLGGKLNQKKLGTFGDVAFFSSERTKIINTIHGGFAACSDEAICTRLEEISQKAQVPDMKRIENLLNTLLYCYYTKVHEDRLNLTHMAQRKYGQYLIPQMTDAEFNGQFEQMYALKMPGAVGELALNQLKKFESFTPHRQQAALKWHKWALNNGYGVANPGKDSDCTWLRYPVIVPMYKKKDTGWIEKELGMEPGVWFQTPCHPQIRKIDDIPVGWDVANTIINLPTGLWVK